MSLLLLILGLVLFVTLVVVHELGHYLAARRNGVGVEEFGIGFPPRARVLKKRKGTVFTLNWLPLGGFVRLKGEHDADETPGSFGAASAWAKSKILLAGVGMNLLAAFVLLTVLAGIGMPKLIDDQFTVASDTKVVQQQVYAGFIQADSPAERAGLLPRDRLTSIGAQCIDYCEGVSVDEITTAEDLLVATEKYAGQPVTINLVRDGEKKVVTSKLRTTEEVEASRETDDPKGYLGIAPAEFVVRRSTWSAPIVAVGVMKQFTVATYQGIASALTGLFTGDTARATEQVAGPVGVFVLLKDSSFLGLSFTLMIIAVISLTLALLNALPIPALDGGRLFLILLFRLLNKPLTKKTEELINAAGFAALMLLFVLITIVDIRRFF